jgi:hypothetical protein
MCSLSCVNSYVSWSTEIAYFLSFPFPFEISVLDTEFKYLLVSAPAETNIPRLWRMLDLVPDVVSTNWNLHLLLSAPTYIRFMHPLLSAFYSYPYTQATYHIEQEAPHCHHGICSHFIKSDLKKSHLCSIRKVMTHIVTPSR